MADFWGPGLDAELAYRHERLFTALRHTPYGDTHDQRGGEHDDLLAATTHEPGSASALAATAAGRLAASRPARAPVDECGAWVAAARIGVMARGSMSTPFVARAQQVDQLTLALQRAGVGEPAAVLIGADAGVGKTRLLRHVAELADAAGARVVVAHCVDLGEIGLPYLPFAEALPSCTRSTPRRSARSSPTDPRSRGCCPGPSGAAAPPDDQSNRLQLFDGLVEVLGAVGRPGHPLLLVLEDLHWADASSRDVLRFLVSRLRDQHLLVVASYRTDDLHRRHPWRPVATELAGTPGSSGSTCRRSPTTSCASSPPR